MWRLAVISIIGVSLGSCGTLPKGGAGPVVSTARIVEAIRCELGEAFGAGNPDPAGMKTWRMLATITINGDSAYEMRPGLTGVAGKAGKASWKAPTSGFSVVGSTKRKIENEYGVLDIGAEIARAPCPAPESPAATQGLDLGHWLYAASAGQPASNANVTPKKVSYNHAYTVGVSAGGGLTFTFVDFSLSFEGNKASASTAYTIDVRLEPQPLPRLLVAEPDRFLSGPDPFDSLRADRDADEEDETIIKVPPGQSIIIGP